jgi:hypothetical protein
MYSKMAVCDCVFLVVSFVNLGCVFCVCRCFVSIINLDMYLCLYRVNF